jgi:hypothetical protein
VNRALWELVDEIGAEAGGAMWSVFRGRVYAGLEANPELVQRALVRVRQAVEEGRL